MEITGNEIIAHIEEHRQVIVSMLGKQPINLQYAANALHNIKALLGELFERNDYLRLQEAIISFGGTFSLEAWPRKKPMDDAFKEFACLIVDFFPINHNDLSILVGNDPGFNEVIIRSATSRKPRYMFDVTSTAIALKKLFANKEMGNLRLMINYLYENRSRISMYSEVMLSTLDCVCKKPGDPELVDNFRTVIQPLLDKTRISARHGINNHNPSDYVETLAQLGHKDLAALVMSTFSYTDFSELPYLELIDKHQLEGIHSYCLRQTLQSYFSNHEESSKKPKIGGKLLYLALKHMDKGDLANLPSHMAGQFPVSVIDECARLVSQSKGTARKIQNKLEAGLRYLVEKKLDEHRLAGKLKDWHRMLDKHPHFSNYANTMNSVKRSKLEIDMGL